MGKCLRCPEKWDTGNENGAKVCPVSVKQGHWERKVCEIVTGVPILGHLARFGGESVHGGAESGTPCTFCRRGEFGGMEFCIFVEE